MHLHELIAEAAQFGSRHTDNSVPDWAIGAFRRRSITFANGQTDVDTRVFWLQSRNLTVDLRLLKQSEQTVITDITTADETELQAIANYEGWCAKSLWQDELLSWSGGTSLQLHNRWPEPAQLKRVGDCLVEFAPSGAYVEDWRLLSRVPGPLVGLELIDEVNASTGVVRHRQGALIINGDWAGLVLGRAEQFDPKGAMLRDLVRSADVEQLQALFNFEVSIGRGNVQDGFTVEHSTNGGRVGQSLLPCDGFEIAHSGLELHHQFTVDGEVILRRYKIDSIEQQFPYSDHTEQSDEAEQWFVREQGTLARYLKQV